MASTLTTISPTTTAHPSIPTTPPQPDGVSWISAFIAIHSLPDESHVYIFMLWAAILLVITILTILHYFGTQRGGYFVARWMKWSLIRRSWRKPKPRAAPPPAKPLALGGAPAKKENFRQPNALPSNAQLLTLSLIFLLVSGLCLVGPDYIYKPPRTVLAVSAPASTVTLTSVSTMSSISTIAVIAPTGTDVIPTLTLPVSAPPATTVAPPASIPTDGGASPISVIPSAAPTDVEPPAPLTTPVGSDAPVPTDPTTPPVRRAFNPPLAKRAFNPATVASYRATWTISKSFWTSAARFGDIAFGLFPLVILLVLKAPPFALFSLPFTARLHYEKLVFLHRWVGRMIWLVTTVHVGLWAVVVTETTRSETGKSAWDYVFLYQRFRFAWTAYLFLTLIVFTSLRPIRNKAFTFFYTVHLISIPSMLIFAGLHRPQIGGWCWFALTLWAGERTYRAIKWIYINGIFRKPKVRKPLFERYDVTSPMLATAQDDDKAPVRPTSNVYGYQKVVDNDSDEDLPTPGKSPYGNEDWKASTETITSPLQSPYDDPFVQKKHNRNSSSLSQHPTSPNTYPPVNSYFSSPPRNLAPAALPNSVVIKRYTPPPGYAHADILPGNTIRLRLVTPGYLLWAAGQHFLVHIPSVNRFTTHPFSAASVCDVQVGRRVPGKHGSGGSFSGLGNLEEAKSSRMSISSTHSGVSSMGLLERAPGQAEVARELVFIIRAKGGWTKKLLTLIQERQKVHQALPKGESLPAGSPVPPAGPGAGIVLRTMVDGPFGGSVGARWATYSTVIIVAGGSGVSFAMSVLEYVCLCMSGRDGKYLGGMKGGWGMLGYETQRVRFVMSVREYDHIQWCASVVRRCMKIVPPESLEVSIHVTSAKPSPAKPLSSAKSPRTEKAPPVPPLPQVREEVEKRAPTSPTPASPTPSAHHPHMASLAEYESSDDEELESRKNLPGALRPGAYAGYGTGMGSWVAGGMGARGSEGPALSGGPLQYEPHDLDYTNYGGEDDTRLPAEDRLSRALQLEGKMRRKTTRRIKRGDSAVDGPRPGMGHKRGSSSATIAAGTPPVPTKKKLVDPYGGLGEQSGISIDPKELEDTLALSENAKGGRPDLGQILRDEAMISQGRVVVACCGPTALNAELRLHISNLIDPDAVRDGDFRGTVDLITEDFET